MPNLIFLYENSNTCLALEKDCIHKIKTENANLTVEIGNKLLSGESVENYDKEVVEEIDEFIKSNFINSSTAREEVVIYSNIEDKNISKMTKEEFLSSTKSKIFFLTNLSAIDLKKYFPSKLKNAVGIIDIDNVLIITPLLNDDSACLSCIIERWIEANPEVYQYRALHKNRAHVPYENHLLDFAIKKAKIHLKENYEQATIIRKTDYRIINSNVLSRESCSICFGEIQKETANFEIGDKPYLQQGNGHRSNSYHDSLSILEKLVNPLGPVVELEEYGFDDKLNMSVFQSVMSYNPLQKSFPFHGGKGPDYYQAKLSAIGEAMERYNARQFGNEKIIRESYKNLLQNGIEVVSPESLCLDKEYPYPYSDDKQIEWVESRRLSDFKKVLIPANVVFFLYHPAMIELQFIPQDTTGLASGLNIEEAILQGLLEVIERDSYSIYYRNQLPASTISLEGIKDTQLSQLVQNIENQNIQLHLKWLKNDLSVYVVHCTTEDKNGDFPIFTHGSGASLNPYVAVTRAITECVQLRTSQIEINKQKEHFLEDKEYEAYLEWGNGNKEYVGNLLCKENDSVVYLNQLPNYSTGSFKKDIEMIVREIKMVGHETYVCDLSRSDNPIKTVRVVVPGFQTTDDSLRRITERMKTLPAKLGLNHLNPLFDKPLFS
ncbi:YcaO-like family protein [Geobacillus thermoleovorans]|uniref:YcaO-like family protein n=1 Tax=Geobacillus thermoleovorans TaxID=33941 RepID=UPI00345C5479